MSYILDALRRAEAERDRGSLPGLNTQAGVPVHVDRRLLGRGNPWLWLLAGMVGAVLLVMGVRLWWQWATADVVPGPDVAAQAPAVVPAAVVPSTPPAPVKGSAAQAVAAPPGLPPVPAVTAPPAVAAQAADSVPTAASATSATASARVKAGVAAAPVLTAAPAPGTAAGPPSSPVVAPSNATPIAQPDGRIHAPADLPAEIARELPNLVFGGLIQLEDPPRRSLIINGVIYMEGDLVQPDLVLEQIRLNAAVLRYKGHRYQLPI